MENRKTLTLGSLFDGSGGFPLGGMIAEIEPRWSSEIEPFPILVTHKRLPKVRHYGDVSTLSGAELEPVDIITFGSPCQDMSIAGRRAGLDGERSGLFHQAIRIIKEMREATNGEKPRYCVWENVPGAFSSNGGDDFRAVLEAVIGVKEEGVQVPAPADHRWAKSDVLLGDGWSLAYRVLDAQYWGVPQRRARIYLVADFAGGSAGEVLFKSEGVSGYTPQGFRSWERAAGGTEDGAGEAGGRPDAGSGVLCVNTQGNSGVGITEDKSLALVAQDHGNHPAVMQAVGYDGYNGAVTDDKAATLGVNCGMSTGRNGVIQAAGFSTEHSAQSRSIGYEEETSPTLRAGVVPAALALDNHPTDSRVKIAEDGKVQTLTERMGTGGGNVPLVAEPEPVTLKIRCGRPGGGKGPLLTRDKSATLGTNNDQTLFQPAYGIAKEAFNAGESAAFNFAVNEEVSPTLQATGPGAVAKPEIKAFGVCSKGSHAMLSDNPKAGFYEAETSRTLDQGGGNPTCNQGGICIVAPAPDDKETYDVRFTSDGTKNARGHCYRTDISRCLDTSEANPDSNHGGIAVVAFAQNQRDEVRNLEGKSGALSAQPGMKQQTYVMQGSMSGREEKNGAQADGFNEDATYCATTGSFMTVEKEKSHTLMARDYKDPQIVNDTPNEEPVYIVRRLTPVECARLQGFPDWWCSDLAIPNPTEEELAFWAEVWETWRKLTNPDGKPKTEKQLRKWLAQPYTDAAEYKLWGNGVALPCVYFVLSGIAWAAGK